MWGLGFKGFDLHSFSRSQGPPRPPGGVGHVGFLAFEGTPPYGFRVSAFFSGFWRFQARHCWGAET